MPSPFEGAMTLLGILQNGNMVLREPKGNLGGQSLSTPGDSGGSTGGGAQPSSGFDPGQTIY